MPIEKNYNQEPNPEEVFESKGQEDILEVLTERIELEKRLLLTAPTMRFAVERLSDQDVVSIWTQAKQRIEAETGLVQFYPTGDRREFDPLTIDLEEFDYPVPVFWGTKEETVSGLQYIDSLLSKSGAAGAYMYGQGIFIREKPEDLRERMIALGGAGQLSNQSQTITHEFMHALDNPDDIRRLSKDKSFFEKSRFEMKQNRHGVITRGLVKIIAVPLRQVFKKHMRTRSTLTEGHAFSSQNLGSLGFRSLKSELLEREFKGFYGNNNVDMGIAALQAIDALHALGKYEIEIGRLIAQTGVRNWDKESGRFTNIEKYIDLELSARGLDQDDLPGLIDLYKAKRALEVARARAILQEELLKIIPPEQLDKNVEEDLTKPLIGEYRPGKSFTVFPNSKEYEFTTRRQRGFTIAYDDKTNILNYSLSEKKFIPSPTNHFPA